MYESRDACPWYQSEDLDFDAAQAGWERQRQADGWADYVADMVERQAADDAELLALLEPDEARQAGRCPCRTSDADAESKAEESKMEFTWEPLNWSPAKCWRTIARRASGRRVTVLVSSRGHAGATWHITPGGAPHGLTNAEDPRPRAEAWLRAHGMVPG